MDDETLRQASNLAKHMAFMKKLTAVGCDEAQLAAVATWTRDVLDNYSKFFSASDLGGAPTIVGYFFNDIAYEPQATYICFGDTVEAPTAESRARAEHIKKHYPPAPSLDGEEWFVMYPDEQEGASSWLVFNTENPMDDMFNNDKVPFVGKNVPVDEYFEGVILVEGEFRIRRSDIIAYECYTKGRTHAKNDRYLKRNREVSGFLDRFDALPPFYRRNNVDYMLLSIVRDLTQSEDAGRFIDRFERT